MPRCQIVPCPIPEVHREVEMRCEMSRQIVPAAAETNYEGTRARCTGCGKWVGATVPAGGDGSALVYYRHDQSAPTPAAGPMTTDDAAALKARAILAGYDLQLNVTISDPFYPKDEPEEWADGNFEALANEIAQAIRDAVAAEREALEKYGRHTDSCDNYNMARGGCICGWDEARAAFNGQEVKR